MRLVLLLFPPRSIFVTLITNEKEKKSFFSAVVLCHLCDYEGIQYYLYAFTHIFIYTRTHDVLLRRGWRI